MKRVVIFNKSIPEIGLSLRNTTHGEESKMVIDFIDYYCDKFLRYNKSNNLAVFIEPRIASGFPDLVLASYLPSILDNWSISRNKINVGDLKILSCLLQTGGAKGEQIFNLLKIPEREILFSLERLLDVKLVVYENQLWKSKSLRKVFSIKKLVSVEAKIGDISHVIEQSFVNTWFASHSYALSNAIKPHEGTVKIFSKRGIGLYCKGRSFRKVVEAQPLLLPSSYQSLLFNEWIGNSLTM